jgi:hypothetical protein
MPTLVSGYSLRDASSGLTPLTQITCGQAASSATAVGTTKYGERPR